MKNRIKKVRQHKDINLSQEAFGKKLGVTGAAISKIESGDRNASEQIILGICRVFNVNETWLRTGEGEMFLETPDTAMEQLAQELGLDEFMQGIVSEYLKLNEEQRKVVRNFVKKIAEQSNKGSAALAFAPMHTPTIEEETRAEAEEYYRQRLMEREAETESSASFDSERNMA